MYNNVEIKFLPKNWETGFSQKEKEALDTLNALVASKSQAGLKKNRDGYYSIKMNKADTCIDPLIECLIKLKKDTDFAIYVNTKYEPTDFSSASAYLLRFGKKYEYYDDWNDDRFNSFKLVCDSSNCHDISCKTWEHTETIYAKPLKKQFEGFTGATNYDFSEDSIISDELYKYLLEHNFSESFFKPVYQKKGQRWAYFLDGSDSLLPSNSLQCNLLVGPEMCPKCNRVVWHIDEQINEQFSNLFRNKIVLGNPHKFERWTIASNVSNSLKPINLTSDFFIANRLTIVNKEFFNLISAKVPEIIKSSIPIFDKVMTP